MNTLSALWRLVTDICIAWAPNPAVERPVSLGLALRSPTLSPHSVPSVSLKHPEFQGAGLGRMDLCTILKLEKPSENPSFQYLPSFIFESGLCFVAPPLHPLPRF